eukprot:TRINITY_DN2577_c0_g1_i1.p1 TRINITY_DN2577_c0_g1~~TRINITY_DN2577_c0_g1_i1.p1  ORF type:complete len:355 (-),score=144.46 TRINITY_DN2577_c0_g1_i1:373-1437(-)
MSSIVFGLGFLFSSWAVTFCSLFYFLNPYIAFIELCFISLSIGHMFGAFCAFWIMGIFWNSISTSAIALISLLFTCISIGLWFGPNGCSKKMQTVEKLGRSVDKVMFTLCFSAFLLFAYSLTTFVLIEENGVYWSKGNDWRGLAYHLSVINSFRFGCNQIFQPWQIHSPFMAATHLGYGVLPDFLSALLIHCGFSLNDAIIVPSLASGVSLVALLFLVNLRFTRSVFAALIAVIFVFFAGGIGFLSFFFETGVSFASIFAQDYVTEAGGVSTIWLGFLQHLLLPQRNTLFGYPIFLSIILLIWIAFQHSNSISTSPNLSFSNSLTFLSIPAIPIGNINSDSSSSSSSIVNSKLS